MADVDPAVLEDEPAARNRYPVGNHAPAREEVTAFDLPVRGSLPPELAGRLLRNGPNPVDPDPATYHWFSGDGMVHGIERSDGRARSYRNRWVRTEKAAAALGEAPPPGPPHLRYHAVDADGRLTRTEAITIGGPAMVHDFATGTSVVHDVGRGRGASEGVFVPTSGAAAEDEGWVLAVVYDAARGGSDLVVLDATDFAAPPVATVALPQRVPFGFHGSWVPGPA